MSTIIESLRCLEHEVSTVNSFVHHKNQPGNRLAPAFEQLLTTSAEVAEFVNEEWRKIPLSENRRAFIQEQSYRLHRAMTLFHLRCGMSTYELVSEIECRNKVTEISEWEGGITTGDSASPRGVSPAMTRQPTFNTFNVYQGGIVNYQESNVNEHTINTNSRNTTKNTNIASSNNF